LIAWVSRWQIVYPPAGGAGAATVSTLPSIDIAVGFADGSLHFAFGADGAWVHAVSDTVGEMFVTSHRAAAFAEGAFQFSLPVLNSSAVIPAAGAAAYNCFTAVCSGLVNGWIQ
jgi:hypothetical protein